MSKVRYLFSDEDKTPLSTPRSRCPQMDWDEATMSWKGDR